MPWTVKGHCTQITCSGKFFLIWLYFTYTDHQKREQTVGGSWVLEKWISKRPQPAPDWSGDQEVEVTFRSRKEPSVIVVSFTHNGQPLRGKFHSSMWQLPPHALLTDFQAMLARPARSTYRR